MDFVLTLAVIQGVILLFILYLKKFSDKRTVNLLGILLLLTVIIMFGRITYQPEFLLKYWAFVSLPDVLLFLFGPIIYQLTLSLLKLPKLSVKSKWLHYLPALIHIFILNTILGLILIDKMPYMDMNHLVLLYKLMEGAGILSCSFYLIKSFLIFQKHGNIYLQLYSSVEPPVFLRHFFLVGSTLIFIWAGSFIAKLFGLYEFMDYRIYQLFWIALAFFIYFLTYQFLLHPGLFELLPIQLDKNTTENSEGEEERVNELLEFMKTTKPYLDPEINLETLARQSGFKRNDLSALINNSLGKNFFDLINSYRIQEFIELYQKHDKPKPTFIELAYQVGFNSKSVFNRAFKKETTTTPSQYFKQ
ncbi:MAG: AraC family transcriptional regulator [Flavobacteriales bacterium]|nr:AraC family transcriptional regulator [Flavobacteriales bacterium]